MIQRYPTKGRPGLRKPGRLQRGAAAIEFALVFLIFFVVFYGIVSYALVFVLSQGFSFAANEGARAAVAIDRTVFADEADYLDNGVEPRVKEIVVQTLSWLPAKAFEKAVGTDGANVLVDTTDTGALRVTIRYPDYKGDPLIPILSFPGFGDVPNVPNDLQGVSVIGLDA
jgi:Flp pilus assembly protein TadG